MPEIVMKALYFFLQVLLYSGAWFVAWVSILGVIVLYRKMKKEAEKEKRKLDEIIVKRNEEKEKTDKDILAKSEELKKLDEEIQKKKIELGIQAAESVDKDEAKPAEQKKPEEDVKKEDPTPATPTKQGRAKKPKS